MEATIGDTLSQLEQGAASFLPESFTKTIGGLASYGKIVLYNKLERWSPFIVDALKKTMKDAALETSKDYVPENVTYGLAAYDDLNLRYKEYSSLERKGKIARGVSVLVLVLSFTAVVVLAAL